ncbi:vacuolar protein sorting-associated protein 26C [Arctopsyche grandis]|uniref:vacuolar protein sorting-associated protein 26C n=1 Tax=Arctopsyche grandis TaxID=121162 RepID=UPI00406D7E52
MSVNLEIKLKKTNKIYHEGECLSGFVIVTSPSDVRHDGISLLMEGGVSLQLSNKNVGMFEAFRNSVKPITLLNCSLDLQTGGKIPSGVTEIPFEFPLSSRQRQPSVAGTQKPNHTQSCLLETYHGVFVSITYSLKCTMKRSFLNKDLNASCQFVVQYRKSKDKIEPKPVRCIISPDTVQSGKGVPPIFSGDNGNHKMPNFNIIAELDSTVCSLDKPFTGQITVKECSIPIKSIDLQLVRVETCGCAEGYAKDATEIQNIQLGEGDVCRNLPIPIHMLLPRLFTCPTTLTTNFKIEFEVNIAIIFHDDHLVTENFPIILTRC